MSPNIEKVDALVKAVLALRTEVRKGKKAAANPKRQEDANAFFRQAEIHAHEIHCLCVELGIATPEEWRYGEKVFMASFGRNFIYNARRPEGV